jgi:DNA (cytosine-5)-methyltransferase 1
LFCGAGGLSEGLRQSGFDVIAAADHDPDACATYHLNFPDTRLVAGDLTVRENHRMLVAEIKRTGERLDLLAGGPPCQAFSQIHNYDRLLADPRNRLYREFVEILEEARPRALLVENVPGLNQLAGGNVRQQIAKELSLGGYYEVVSGVLDAGDFCTPQRRPRLVFIGVEKGLADPELPQGTGITKVLRTGRGPDGHPELLGCDDAELYARLADPADDGVVSVWQALSDLLRPGERYSSAPKSAYQEKVRAGSDQPQDHIPSRTRDDTRRRLEAIPPGGNVYDLPEELLARYLDGKRWGPVGNGITLSRKHFYAYRRLHADWLAWTVNTKADFAYHYQQPRGLSVREAARIQGFPDRFHFTTAPPGSPGQDKRGARHSRYRQVGNAIAPTMAYAIGAQIARLLASARAAERGASQSLTAAAA